MDFLTPSSKTIAPWSLVSLLALALFIFPAAAAFGSDAAYGKTGGEETIQEGAQGVAVTDGAKDKKETDGAEGADVTNVADGPAINTEADAPSKTEQQAEAAIADDSTPKADEGAVTNEPGTEGEALVTAPSGAAGEVPETGVESTAEETALPPDASQEPIPAATPNTAPAVTSATTPAAADSAEQAIQGEEQAVVCPPSEPCPSCEPCPPNEPCPTAAAPAAECPKCSNWTRNVLLDAGAGGGLSLSGKYIHQLGNGSPVSFGAELLLSNKESIAVGLGQYYVLSDLSLPSGRNLSIKSTTGLFKFLFFSDKIVHGSADMAVGLARATIENNTRHHNLLHIEPGVNVELNLTHSLKFALGLSYRWLVGPFKSSIADYISGEELDAEQKDVKEHGVGGFNLGLRLQYGCF